MNNNSIVYAGQVGAEHDRRSDIAIVVAILPFAIFKKFPNERIYSMPNYVGYIITEHTCRAIRLLGAHLYSWSVLQSRIPAKLFGIHSGTKSLRPLQFRQRLHSDSETTRGQLQHLTSIEERNQDKNSFIKIRKNENKPLAGAVR